MKQFIITTIFSFLCIFAFAQVQNWQLQRSDTTEVEGSVYRFMTTDTTTGVRQFATRDFFAEILYQDSMSQIYTNLLAETDTLYDAAYNQLTNGDTISNQFPNEIEVNIVRAINNDSIILFLDTLSYDFAPDYVLGFHNTAVTDSFIRGTIKLIPKDSVSTLEFTQNLSAEILQKNSNQIQNNKRTISWSFLVAFVAFLMSIVSFFKKR